MVLSKKRFPKRAGIFFVFDKQGVIDSYIPYLLRDLKENLNYLLVVVNGVLSEDGRKTLSAVTPNIFVRDNVGFDAWAYKEGLEYIGWKRLAEYDEVVLANYTNFGPVYPFREAFDAMNGRDVDFWGLTKHYGLNFDPYKICKYGYVPAHIQASFIVIRKSMLMSSDFRQFWDSLPLIQSYDESVCYHEVILTKDFEDKGYKSDVYINASDLAQYQEYPLMLYPLELVRNRRCPVFKRKSFFNIYGEFLGVSCGQSTWELYNYLANETNYDVGMIWESILRTCNLEDVKNRTQLNFIMPTTIRYSDDCHAKIALFMYLNDLTRIELCKKYANSMPSCADIVIATSSEEKAMQVKQSFSNVECKAMFFVIAEDKISASIGFLLNFREYILSYDYVCFIHDDHLRFDKPLYDKPSILTSSFTYRCYENVLASPEFVENVIYTFQKDSHLGLLVPPPPNHGTYFYFVGNEWQSYFSYTKELAAQMGLNADIDPEKAPIAPIGNCFWFRTKALRPIVNHDFYRPEGSTERWEDGFIHAMERLYPFIAQSEGYYSGWLLSDVFAKFEITNLYKQLSDCYKTLFGTFGVLDRLPLLNSVSACGSIIRKPKISIVLSNFNGGDLLKHTIQSVIDQTFKDWELIFIDNCSTDHSREIIGSFRDERIKATYFEKDQHMCYAFNYGISVSKGKYIARIDSDDTWLPDKLEKQYAFMEGHPDYGACFTWVNVVDEYDNILTESQSDRVDAFKAQNRDQYEWIRFLYFNGPCLCHPTVLMRKDVLDDVGVYNYSLVQIQDFDLWIRIAKKYPIYVITEKLANYRWFTTGKNISASSATTDTRSYFETAYVLSKYFDDLPDEVFIKAFGEDFVIKGVTDANHLECEKMLLLIRPTYGGNVQRMGGMRKFMDLLERNETREILLREYGITQMYFYELSGSPILFNPYNFESGIIPPPVVLNVCVNQKPTEPGLDLDAIPRKVLLKKLVKRTFSKHRILYTVLRRLYRLAPFLR